MDNAYLDVFLFNHIRELHHSQTLNVCELLQVQFNHIRELHHSQTKTCNRSEIIQFNHIRELHHSQTQDNVCATQC